jgi:hypothetical protein
MSEIISDQELDLKPVQPESVFRLFSYLLQKNAGIILLLDHESVFKFPCIASLTVDPHYQKL